LFVHVLLSLSLFAFSGDVSDIPYLPQHCLISRNNPSREPKQVNQAIEQGQNLPETKTNEQTGGTARSQTRADLDIQGRADCASDTDQLDMAGLELAVGVVVGGLH
jgi:hypothetical protein